jgi:hypothetical protein
MLPSLNADLSSPTNYMQVLNACFYAADEGVFENLHQEPYDNLFSVVDGKVKVTLISGKRYLELYPHANSTEGLLESKVHSSLFSVVF